MIYFCHIQKVQACPGSRMVLSEPHDRKQSHRRNDVDLLVMPSKAFMSHEVNWSAKFDRAIIGVIHASVDLLLNSKEEVYQKQELPGHIIRDAVRERVNFMIPALKHTY